MAAVPNLDFRNANTLWASVLAGTLERSGVRTVIVSPGSRSAPLVMACTAQPGLECIPVLDERSAAFFALGMAKVTGRPSVLVCTSGTAAANYLPAVVEAHESGVPLLVLTADRPPELRACDSGQTIDQQKLYGSAVNFFQELALPEASEPRLRYLRQTVTHAVGRTLFPGAGPVHLNVPFRDPLAPLPDDGTALRLSDAIDWDFFFAQLAPPEEVRVCSPPPPLMPDGHGVIVVGTAPTAAAEEFVAAVAEIARLLGWPVLAGGLSQLRSHASRVPHLVTTYDTILRNESVADRLKPESVLCLGGWPTSKVLREWLESSGAAIWLATERFDNRDALHGRTRQLTVSLSILAASLPESSDVNGYQRMWARYEQRVRAEWDARLEAEPSLFEPKAAWLLARHLPAQTPLVIANSMPVRDVESVWPPGDAGIRLLGNRGANGIDGALSTALGVAHASGRPGVLLTGDLALLHDTNGFLLRRQLRGSLTIILINNRGGGIFEHLPVAQFDPPFEEFFATPQDVDFSRLCAAYEAEHLLVPSWAHLLELVTTLPASGLRVLEIRTDRKHDAALRRRLFREVAGNEQQA